MRGFSRVKVPASEPLDKERIMYKLAYRSKYGFFGKWQISSIKARTIEAAEEIGRVLLKNWINQYFEYWVEVECPKHGWQPLIDNECSLCFEYKTNEEWANIHEEIEEATREYEKGLRSMTQKEIEEYERQCLRW